MIFSRVPVFEQRVDNIMGIAYAMDLLDYAQKVGRFYSCHLLHELLVLCILILSPNLIVCRIVISLILKGELLESTTVGDMAHKPAYFVPGNLFLSQS